MVNEQSARSMYRAGSGECDTRPVSSSSDTNNQRTPHDWSLIESHIHHVVTGLGWHKTHSEPGIALGVHLRGYIQPPRAYRYLEIALAGFARVYWECDGAAHGAPRYSPHSHFVGVEGFSYEGGALHGSPVVVDADLMGPYLRGGEFCGEAGMDVSGHFDGELADGASYGYRQFGGSASRNPHVERAGVVDGDELQVGEAEGYSARVSDRADKGASSDGLSVEFYVDQVGFRLVGGEGN